MNRKINQTYIGVIALLVLVVFLVVQNITQEREMTGDIVAGSSGDITVYQPSWSDGRASIKIYLGKASVDSILIAQTTVQAADTIASLTDLADYATTLQKAQAGTYSKAMDVVKDLMNLNPAGAIQTVLGWMTSAFASAVDENCLVQAVSSVSRDSKGGVTIYRFTNFFTEESSWYEGYYLYSQNEWTGGCVESKVCLKFLYYDGRESGCWW
ncbi:MAG: hypothetical protein AABX71_00945 [Nanoarchaeota archaeon]